MRAAALRAPAQNTAGLGVPQGSSRLRNPLARSSHSKRPSQRGSLSGTLQQSLESDSHWTLQQLARIYSAPPASSPPETQKGIHRRDFLTWENLGKASGPNTWVLGHSKG